MADVNLDFDSLFADLEAKGETCAPASTVVQPQASVALPPPKITPKSQTTDVDLNDFMPGFTMEREIPNPDKPWMKYHKFVLVKTVEETNHIINAAIAAGKCALDLETEGLNNSMLYTDGVPRTVHQIVGFCLSYDGITGYYIPVRHHVEEDDPNVKPVAEVEGAIKRLCLAAQPVLLDTETDRLGGHDIAVPPQVVIGFWNAKFDQEYLYPITGLDYWHPESFEDGMLAAFTLLSSDHDLSLKAKSIERLHDPEGHPYEQIELKELFIKGRKIKFAELDPREPGVLKYAGSDAICTYKHCFEGDLIPLARSPKHCITYRLEKQNTEALRIMERPKIKIDREEVVRLLAEAKQEKEELLQKILALAATYGFQDFNPGSGKQLSDFLFSTNGLNLEPKPDTTSEGSAQYKTDSKTLESLVETLTDEDVNDNVLVWIVKYKQIGKIVGTYLEGMLESMDANDCVRAQFKQTGTATGRFSAPSGNPEDGGCSIPLHGIPARFDPKRPKCANSLRRLFVARNGYTLVKCDYAGQELRIVANLSGEPLWEKEFLHGTGDLHTLTAQAFFGKDEVTKEERSMAKGANFALIYGGGPSSIMRTTGCTKLEGQRRKKAFDKSVPVFAAWMAKQHESSRKNLGVTTAFGRFLAIPEANTQDHKLRAACERYAGNYPTQGSGADIMKISMIFIVKELHKRGWLRNGGDDSVRLLLSVHDELVFEIRNDRVAGAVPVIVDLMESPARLPKPRWKIPLIVDPVLGHSWECKYDWAKLKDGRKAKLGETAKEGEYQIEDRIYQKVPPWLEGLLVFNEGVQQSAQVLPEAVGVVTVPAPSNDIAPRVIVPTPAVAPVAPVVPPAPVVAGTVVIFCLDHLTAMTAKIVTSACQEAQDLDHGQVLHLVDRCSGATLISPDLGVLIDPEVFARELFSRNVVIERVVLN